MQRSYRRDYFYLIENANDTENNGYAHQLNIEQFSKQYKEDPTSVDLAQRFPAQYLTRRLQRPSIRAVISYPISPTKKKQNILLSRKQKEIPSFNQSQHQANKISTQS